VIAYGFSFVLPFLLLAAAALRATARTGLRVRAAAVVAAAALAAVPVAGLPLARWCVNVTGGASVTLTVLAAAHVWRRLAGADPLDAAARRAARWFGAVAGVALYPMALGLGRWDPYALGWRLSPLTVALWAVSLALVLRGNRFGVVLALSALGYDLRVLESPNLWDYVVDPVLAVISVAALARVLVDRARGRAGAVTAAAGAVTAAAGGPEAGAEVRRASRTS